MSLPNNLVRICGEWSGTNQLWMDPQQPAAVSAGAAWAALAARGQFLTLRYTWTFDGKPQEGLLVVGCEAASDRATAAWIDSWHMSDQMMLCRGSIQLDGTLAVQGSYPAPTGPDWGWRIVLDAHEAGRLKLKMYNIAPDTFEIPAGRSREELAVEAEYTRMDAEGAFST